MTLNVSNIIFLIVAPACFYILLSANPTKWSCLRQYIYIYIYIYIHIHMEFVLSWNLCFLYFKPFNWLRNLWHHDEYSTRGGGHLWTLRQNFLLKVWQKFNPFLFFYSKNGAPPCTLWFCENYMSAKNLILQV